MHDPSISTRPWWRSAAIYQVYPRSFADMSQQSLCFKIMNASWTHAL